MYRPNYTEIDLFKLGENIKEIKARLAEGVKLMAVVKDNAYGHGIAEVSRAAVVFGADWLGVSSIEEGIALRDEGICHPILVMGSILPEHAPHVVEYGLTQTVYSPSVLRALDMAAKDANVLINAHLKIDTGMGRLGVTGREKLSNLLGLWQKCSNVNLDGAFTHFAEADSQDPAFTAKQNTWFLRAVENIRAAGFDPILHAANSAAAIAIPETHHDMVRVGIAMYGYHPGGQANTDIALSPVLSWKSRLVQVKLMSPGQTVSYGREFTLARDTVVGTVALGYGDGFFRCLGNRGALLVNGTYAPILGRVTMDYVMADVSSVSGVKAGMEVTIIGEDAGSVITADDIASDAGTISYEVLTAINPAVPRVYKNAPEN